MTWFADHLPILPVLLPSVTAIVLLLLGDHGGDAHGGHGHHKLLWARRIALASTLLFLVVAARLAVEAAGGDVRAYRVGDWPAPYGIVLVIDRLGAMMLLLTAVVALPVLWYATGGWDAHGRHFHALFQFQLMGLGGAFVTGDLFNLFVFFEVLLIASYGLMLHGGGAARVQAGLRYVVVNLAGSSLFLIAVGTLYGVTGTLNMADLARALAHTPAEHLGLARAAGLLLLAVFALKCAAAPLHLWLPATYAQASAPVAALFAIMTKVGVYSILRADSLVFGPASGPLSGLLDPWLLPLALLTLALGTLGALASRRLRLAVAHLVVASAGTLLAAIGLASPQALAAGLYYLPHTSLAAAAAFLLAEAVAVRRGALADALDPGPAMPAQRWLGALFFLTALALAGLPPLAGFIAKFMLLRAAVGHPASVWVLGVLLAAGLMGVILLARSGSLLFYRSSTHTVVEAKGAAALGAELSPIAGLLLLIVALTAAAPQLTTFTLATAAQLAEPAGYIEAVLSAGDG
ncbi:MAG: monovalent cation/H+ antiporter subunit D [Thiobacillaceae bacterium]|nr:monovalent cation/H+ antiporter subunit D [Thiobacillaceae bacterium]